MRPEPDRFADAPPDPRTPETVAETVVRPTRVWPVFAAETGAEDDDEDFSGPFAAW